MQTISLEPTVLTSRRGFLTSRFHEQTAILGLWGDLGMGRRAEEPIAAVLAETSSPDAGNVATPDLHSQGNRMLPAYCSRIHLLVWVGPMTEYPTRARDVSCLITIAHVQRIESSTEGTADATRGAPPCRACRVLRHQKVACQ
jgi:hypothetical protein